MLVSLISKDRIVRLRSSKSAYPDAACRPRPLDPPVTTTTLPLREKILGKSLSSVSYLDILAVFRSNWNYMK